MLKLNKLTSISIVIFLASGMTFKIVGATDGAKTKFR